MSVTLDVWCWVAMLGAGLAGFLLGFSGRFCLDYAELKAYRRIADYWPDEMRELKARANYEIPGDQP